MLVNCLKLYYSAISASFVTNKYALLAPALQTDRQIKLVGNSILFGPLNLFESIRPPNRLLLALLHRHVDRWLSSVYVTYSTSWQHIVYCIVYIRAR